MPRFTIRILDRNRTLLAALDRVTTWSYTRKPSEATDICVTVPYELVREQLQVKHPLFAFLSPSQPAAYDEVTQQPDPLKLQHAQLANLLQVWEGNTLRASGRITTRDVGATSVTIKAMTEEILLEQNLCPAQYGRAFDSWDLADVARFVLKGWHTQRVKSRDQWNAAIEKHNIDIDTEPGLVMLAKDGSGKYISDGYITLRFRRTDFPDFAGWDRIRWVSDNEGPVTTTMQYRYGATPESLNTWTGRITGAFPDEYGIMPETVDADIFDVRINLRTADTESEDPNGNKVGQTPAVFALEMIARKLATVEVGSIPSATGVIVKDLKADNDTALSILVDACKKTKWEFEVIDGRLSIAEKIGTDRRSEFVFRDGTNTRIQRLKDDDAELANVLIAEGPGEGLNRMQITLTDEDSIAIYGVHPKKVEFEEKTEAGLLAAATAYLEEHKSPVQGFDIDDLYPADARPEYGVGDLVRVVDPRSGSVVSSRILEHTRSYSPSGLKVTNRLGKPRASLVQRSLQPRGLIELSAPRLSITPSIKGVLVRVPPPTAADKWSSTEVYLSADQGFTPSPETLADSGRRTVFDFMNLEPGTRFYCRARYVAGDGTPSPLSYEYSAVAGHIGSGDLDPGIAEDIETAVGDLKDLTPPLAPTGLNIYGTLKTFALVWTPPTNSPSIDHYLVRYTTSSDNQATWPNPWTMLSGKVGSTYSVHTGLDLTLGYKYQVQAVSVAQVPGEWSAEKVAGKPDKVDLGNQVDGTMTLTDSLVIAAGRMFLDAGGLKATNQQNEETISIDSATGNARFAGTVQAKELLIPVRSA